MQKYRFYMLILAVILITWTAEPLQAQAAVRQNGTSSDFTPIRAGPDEQPPAVDETKKEKTYNFIKQKINRDKTGPDSVKTGSVSDLSAVLKSGGITGAVQETEKETEAGLQEEKENNSNNSKGSKTPPDETFEEQFRENHPPPDKEAQSGIVLVQRLMVRDGPCTNYNANGFLEKGNIVTVLSVTSGWAEIVFQGGKAWVKSDYLRMQNNNPEQDKPFSETKKQLAEMPKKNNEERQPQDTHSGYNRATVKAPVLNVRDDSSLNGRVVGTVKEGETFVILEEKNNWLKIEYKHGLFGWIAGWFVNKATNAGDAGDDRKTPGRSSPERTEENRTATILFNRTNIREQPDLKSRIIRKANAGESFSVMKISGDWVKILLENGETAYVARRLTDISKPIPRTYKKEKNKPLINKVIIVDPGHGGKDSGATGAAKTIEKTLTLQTGLILFNKLEAEGANVILTRSSDIFIPLQMRVRLAHVHEADAFISIHYDSTTDKNVSGITSYYYHSPQKTLAASIHGALAEQINLRDRGVRFGDYYVIRENEHPAVLLELGYLSNPREETLISSQQYQEQVSEAIVRGLEDYFKE